MVRQQPAADGDRPHYYSQYWINVALGKPNAPAPEAEEQELISPTALLDTLEAEPELPPPPTRPEPVRPEPVRPAKKAPERKQEPARLSSLADLADIAELMKNSAAMDDDVVPDIEANNASEALPPVVTNFDLSKQAEEPVAEVEADEGIEPYEDFDEYEFDEDEEEDEWGGRRPGKPGPKKPTKPQRPPRRREF
ncbi:MAG TPA: hypothetical protein VF120_03625 [Ktedonobacterales bacterium]